MFIDGASPGDPGSGQRGRPHRLGGALVVGAITFAAMAMGPFTAGGVLGKPSHLLIFTPRTPMIPSTEYHRCARGDAWVACSTRGSHRVVRCVSPRASLATYNCGNSDALPAAVQLGEALIGGQGRLVPDGADGQFGQSLVGRAGSVEERLIL